MSGSYKPFEDSAGSDTAGCADDALPLAAALLDWGAVTGPFVGAGAELGARSCDAGCMDTTFGELVLLVFACAPGKGVAPTPGVADGGGGNGAMPILSFAAAAAAALAYFNPSPASLVGTAAGFIPTMPATP
jgi:hypothetical protein